MKRFVILPVLFICLNCLSQSLLYNNFMYQLPRTADDFQNYQFDYPLENGMDVKSSYYMDSDFSAFDDVEIYPFELQEKTKVKSILFAVYQKNNFLAIYGKASYNSKGQLTNYESKNKISETYVYGFDKWSEIRGVSRELTNCVPNSFTYQTKPTRNAKGLITNVESELAYTYDSQDRVVEVNLRNGYYKYHYEYVGESKNIRKITVYKSDRLSADAIYSYSNNKIISVDCHLYMSSGREGSIESEFHKTYKYDSHNKISEIIFQKKEIGGSENKIHYTFLNEYDSKGKVLKSRISRMRTHHVGKYTSGSDKTPTIFVRKYTYDEHGNWIKIEDDEGYIQRTIEYRSDNNGVIAISNSALKQQNGISINTQKLIEEINSNYEYAMEVNIDEEERIEYLRKVDSSIDELAQVLGESFYSQYSFAILQAAAKCFSGKAREALKLCDDIARRINEDDVKNVTNLKLLVSCYDLARIACNKLNNLEMAKEYTRKKNDAENRAKVSPQ